MTVETGSWVVPCTCGDELRVEVRDEWRHDALSITAAHSDWTRGGWVTVQRHVSRVVLDAAFAPDLALRIVVEGVIRELNKETGCGDYALVEREKGRRHD